MAIAGFVGEIFFEDKVVVHRKDGRILKGHTDDFNPEADGFTLHPYKSDNETLPVAFEELKAVFHVRTFEGNREHPPSPEEVGEIVESRFRPAMQRARKALLEFQDGERMWGFAQGIDSGDPGFFFFPTDPHSNNLRVYVIRSSLKDLILLDV